MVRKEKLDVTLTVITKNNKKSDDHNEKHGLSTPGYA